MVPSATTTEFGAALAILDITQAHAGRLFQVTERHVRRWKRADRSVPVGVAIVLRLLIQGAVSLAQVELAATSISVTNGSAKGEPPVKPKPEQSTSARAEVGAFAGLSPAAAAVVALSPGGCRWPLGGSPQDHDFQFCNGPISEPPYCPRHRALAYLPPRTGSGRGVRGAYGRRLAISGVFSATGASQAPATLPVAHSRPLDHEASPC